MTSFPFDQLLSRRAFTTGVVLTASGTVLAGCGDGKSSKGQQTKMLRIGATGKPTNLDPARGGGEDSTYHSLGYDPLIYHAADGSLQPRLATSWGYVGKGNRVFELKLREGVTFSDGEPLNAEAVKANVEYYRKAPGSQSAPFLAPVSSIKAVDDLTVRVTFSEPQPVVPLLFTQMFWAGNLISPAAIREPDKLAKATYGAGPYVLKPDETVSGDHYTYVPNPRYWNPEAIEFDKVIIKILPNANTALSAIKTGQVDVIGGGYETVAEAKAAGLGVAYFTLVAIGLILGDRSGKLSKPLADVRVRQALNYAIDREKVAKALFGEYGIPTDQESYPGGPGYHDDAYYSYDPAKTKQLLTEAGYPDGLTFSAAFPNNDSALKISQAIAGELAKVGVTLQIKTAQDWISETTKNPACILGWGILPPYYMARAMYLRDASPMNPFHSSDPTIESIYKQSLVADEEKRAELDRQLVAQVRELAWLLPICLVPIFTFHRPNIDLGWKEGLNVPGVDAWRPV